MEQKGVGLGSKQDTEQAFSLIAFSNEVEGSYLDYTMIGWLEV